MGPGSRTGREIMAAIEAGGVGAQRRDATRKERMVMAKAMEEMGGCDGAVG